MVKVTLLFGMAQVIFIRYVAGLQFSGGVFNKTAEAKISNGTIVIRAPEMLIGGKDDVVINLRNRENGLKEAGFRCHLYDLAPLLLDKEMHISQVKPVVTKFGSADIVHHMDLFVCRSFVDTDVPVDIQERNYWCRSNQFMKTSTSGGSSCSQMIWVYDKGALTYKFPKNAGIRIGKNGGYERILLQIHYLLPKGYKIGSEDGFLDSSGFEILTETQRSTDSHLFAFIDAKMVIPAQQINHHVSVHLSSSELAQIVGNDLKQFGEIKPFAVHLHAHNYATSLWLDHYRNGKKIDEYGSLRPFKGYGPDQSFFNLPENSTTIRLGDSLTFNCVYDTTSRQRMIRYGVGHGDEMCGPVVLYMPHSMDHTESNIIETSCYGPGNCRSNPRRLG